MALRSLKALWASGNVMPITTLEFNLVLGYRRSGSTYYQTPPWYDSQKETVNLYYVLSNDDIELDGQVYSASCFSVALPERSENTFQDLTFSIGSVNREIMHYLSRILRNDGKDLNTVRLSQWNPDSRLREFDIEMVINSVHFSGASAQFTASFADLVNTEFPKLRYTSENAPGIIYVSN